MSGANCNSRLLRDHLYEEEHQGLGPKHTGIKEMDTKNENQKLQPHISTTELAGASVIWCKQLSPIQVYPAVCSI